MTARRWLLLILVPVMLSAGDVLIRVEKLTDQEALDLANADSGVREALERQDQLQFSIRKSHGGGDYSSCFANSGGRRKDVELRDGFAIVTESPCTARATHRVHLYSEGNSIE